MNLKRITQYELSSILILLDHKVCHEQIATKDGKISVGSLMRQKRLVSKQVSIYQFPRYSLPSMRINRIKAKGIAEVLIDSNRVV